MQKLRRHYVDALGGIVFDPLHNRDLSYGLGAPSSAVAGYNVGSLYLDETNAVAYVNTGTLASSTWTAVATVGGTQTFTGNLTFSGTNTHSGAETFTGGLTVTTTDVTITDVDIVTGTTTGTKLPKLATQKIGFFGATPIVQPANTVDYVTMLTNLGLRGTGGTAPATFPGKVVSTSPSLGVGYATGAGGVVTQSSNRTTGVTINTVTGQITTNNASLAAAAKADFIVTNSSVAATDVIVANITPGGTGSPRVDVVNVASNAFTLRVTNDHASTADTSADVINFAVIKGVAA